MNEGQASRMLISLITVCFNSVKTIDRTIQSVLTQTYKNIQYIVIDGQSTDGTREIIESYKKNIDVIISEPDDGIYDAMNKGLGLANGRIIGLLNSDDYFVHNDIIKNVVDTFMVNSVDAVHGKLIVEKSGKILRNCVSKQNVRQLFFRGRHPHHPTIFLKKSIYDRFGNFDVRYGTAADYELMLRLFVVKNIASFYLDEYVVIMSAGGASQHGIKAILAANISCLKAWDANGIPGGIFFISMKLLQKIVERISALAYQKRLRLLLNKG